MVGKDFFRSRPREIFLRGFVVDEDLGVGVVAELLTYCGAVVVYFVVISRNFGRFLAIFVVYSYLQFVI